MKARNANRTKGFSAASEIEQGFVSQNLQTEKRN